MDSSTVLIFTSILILLPVSRSKNLNEFGTSASNHNCKFGINNICAEGLECFQVFESEYICARSCNEKWDCFRHRKSKRSIDGLNDYETKIYKDLESFLLKELNISMSQSSTPLITREEFESAVLAAGYDKPSPTKYIYIVSFAEPIGLITTKNELAMFLTHVLWESDGFRAVKEYACLRDGCPKNYKSKDDKPNKNYFGRGYIQLTWAVNYIKASRSLFNDDRLLNEPEIVANDEKIAWATAFWFWRSSVHYSIPSELKKGYFGATTNQINGELECKGNNQKAARIRFEKYVAIMKALNLSDEPNEHGCYN